jgi:hypothetical protein
MQQEETIPVDMYRKHNEMQRQKSHRSIASLNHPPNSIPQTPLMQEAFVQPSSTLA